MTPSCTSPFAVEVPTPVNPHTMPPKRGPKAAPKPPPKLATLLVHDSVPDANPWQGFAQRWFDRDRYVNKASQV